MIYRSMIYAAYFLWFDLQVVFAAKNGDVIYKGGFSEDVWPCENFQNDVLIAGLKLEMVSDEGGDEALGLNGAINIYQDIVEGIEMDIKVWKFMEIGKEFLYNARGDICSSLDSEETPWYQLTSTMNITSCPIFKGEYPIKNLKVDLSFAQDIMCHEFCGEYAIDLAFVDAEDELNEKKVACYELQVTISEVTVEDEDK